MAVAGAFSIDEGTVPVTPAAGKRKLYAKSTGFYQIDSAGAETALAGVTSVAGQIGPVVTTAQLVTALDPSFLTPAEGNAAYDPLGAATAAQSNAAADATTKANAAQAFAIQRANHTGTQTSTTISDFVEAAQDAVGALLTTSNTITPTYNDAGNAETFDYREKYASLVTAASKVYNAVTDIGLTYERINGGAAMTDTLPTLAAGDNGWTLHVHNTGTTVAETLTFSAGGAIFPGGGTSYVLNANCRQTFIWTGTKFLFGAGNGNLVKISPGTTPVGAGNIPMFGDTTGRSIGDTGLPYSRLSLFMGDLHFDLVANGGADPNLGANVTTILTNAVATVAAAGGGIVWVPKGNYRLDSQVAMSGNLVTIKGVSRVASKLVRNFAAGGDTIASTGIFNRLETLRMEGASSTLVTANFAFSASAAATNNSLQWVDIIYHHSGVKATGQLCRMEDMNIREMGANAANGQLILIDAFTDQVIRAIVADNPTNPVGFGGLRLTNLSSLIFTDSQIIHCGNGLDMVPSGTNTLPSLYCANTFFDQGFIGINAVPGSGSISRSKFSQVWASGNSIAGVRLNGQNINGFDMLGMDIYGNPIGIEALDATNWSVRNSRLAGNTSAPIRTTAKSYHSFVIADCDLGNSGGFGANAMGPDIQAGTYKRYQIVDNRGLDSNTVKGINDLGSVAAGDQKVVVGNLGHNAVPASIGADVSFTTAEVILTQLRVPAGTRGIGETFLIQMAGTGPLAAGNFTFRVRVGPLGTTADPAAYTSSAGVGVVTGRHGCDLTAVMKTATSVRVEGPCFSNAAVFAPAVGAPPAATAVTTTADWFITLTGTMSASTSIATSGRIAPA